MKATKSRLHPVMATLMSLLVLIVLAVTRLHLIVADALLANDQSKRCARPVRCSPCV